LKYSVYIFVCITIGYQCTPGLQLFYFIYSVIVLLVGLSAPWLPISPHYRPYILASTVIGGLIPATHWLVITPAIYRDSIFIVSFHLLLLLLLLLLLI
jgi:hypothetical protein